MCGSDEVEDRAMSEKTPVKVTVSNAFLSGFGLGVFWSAWDAVGFWWALLYGMFWPVWLGYLLAEKLL
jgi:hypothetical protein